MVKSRGFLWLLAMCVLVSGCVRHSVLVKPEGYEKPKKTSSVLAIELLPGLDLSHLSYRPKIIAELNSYYGKVRETIQKKRPQKNIRFLDINSPKDALVLDINKSVNSYIGCGFRICSSYKKFTLSIDRIPGDITVKLKPSLTQVVEQVDFMVMVLGRSRKKKERGNQADMLLSSLRYGSGFGEVNWLGHTVGEPTHILSLYPSENEELFETKELRKFGHFRSLIYAYSAGLIPITLDNKYSIKGTLRVVTSGNTYPLISEYTSKEVRGWLAFFLNKKKWRVEYKGFDLLDGFSAEVDKGRSLTGN